VRGEDGSVLRIVETKAAGDASIDELAIHEVNTGIYAFDGGLLAQALADVRTNNAQGEYYLTDIVTVLRERGVATAAHEISDPEELLGVNDRVALATVRAAAQRRIHEQLMVEGATIVDPASTVIDAGVEIGQDAVVAPFSSLLGTTCVGARAQIGPLTTLISTRVGASARVVHSYADGADVGDRVSVGPFAFLRPGAVLREGAKAGTFVEIKNSTLGAGAKVPHLSYIGDTDIGERANLGAGTITANYDGVNKHRTSIGAGAFVAVDTMFVAPVSLGEGAYTGAGSVITEDVPPGGLGIARSRQTTIEGYGERRRAGRPAADPTPGDEDAAASTADADASAAGDDAAPAVEADAPGAGADASAAGDDAAPAAEADVSAAGDDAAPAAEAPSDDGAAHAADPGPGRPADS
jgi:bifunctional UDP-N-acetylglucosamine pyrophosphorylase/glucosamine-1-phosphate N-acetyltransferase